MRRKIAIAIVGALAAGWAACALTFFADDRPLGTPVRGVRAAAIRSTFGAPRPGGRRHQGADVFAPRGTPVLAVHDGIVVHVGTNPLGGTVIHTLGRRGVLCYYAHLDRTLVTAAQTVREGEPIGTVGNTGNARTTRPHLHLETRPLALALIAVDPVDLLGEAAIDGGRGAPIHR